VQRSTGRRRGQTIPPYYDSLIAKVIVWDETREASIARTLRALAELELEGVPTTRDVAAEILRSAEFASGDYSTSLLEERLVAA
jgi:acetyl-CoA carboxylase biotin carboxylase subunit